MFLSCVAGEGRWSYRVRPEIRFTWRSLMGPRAQNLSYLPCTYWGLVHSNISDFLTFTLPIIIISIRDQGKSSAGDNSPLDSEEQSSDGADAENAAAPLVHCSALLDSPG